MDKFVRWLLLCLLCAVMRAALYVGGGRGAVQLRVGALDRTEPHSLFDTLARIVIVPVSQRAKSPWGVGRTRRASAAVSKIYFSGRLLKLLRVA